jgi:hypothetical protein
MVGSWTDGSDHGRKSARVRIIVNNIALDAAK